MKCKLYYLCPKNKDICCSECSEICIARCKNKPELCRLTSENFIETKVRKDNKSGITGIHFKQDHNSYSAQISKGGKSYEIGCFKTKSEAFEARCEAVKHLDNLEEWIAEFRKTRKKGRKKEVK